MNETPLKGGIQSLELEYLFGLSLKANDKKEENSSESFSEREKDFMAKEYLGDSGKSFYCKSKEIYLNASEPFIKVSTSKENRNQSVILSSILNILKKTIGLKGLDAIFGNAGREEILSIAEDSFLRSLNTYKVPQNLRDEINKKMEDDSYKMKLSAFNQFNSYIRTVIKRDVLNFIKIPGKYEKPKIIEEEYFVTDKNGEKKEKVVKTSKVKGEYIPDVSRSPHLPLNLINENKESEDFTDNDVVILEKDLERDKTFGSYDASFQDVDDILDRKFIRGVFVKIYNTLSPREQFALRNNDEFCEVFGLEKYTQEQISEYLGLSQGTISKLCADANFKVAAKVLREGYDFDERIFK